LLGDVGLDLLAAAMSALPPLLSPPSASRAAPVQEPALFGLIFSTASKSAMARS
jgi:hypothetical protein